MWTYNMMEEVGVFRLVSFYQFLCQLNTQLHN